MSRCCRSGTHLRSSLHTVCPGSPQRPARDRARRRPAAGAGCRACAAGAASRRARSSAGPQGRTRPARAPRCSVVGPGCPFCRVPCHQGRRPVPEGDAGFRTGQGYNRNRRLWWGWALGLNLVTLEQHATHLMYYSGIPAGTKAGRESLDLCQPPIVRLHGGKEINRGLFSEVLLPWPSLRSLQYLKSRKLLSLFVKTIEIEYKTNNTCLLI